MEIKNVDIYVEKYLRSYKKAGMSLAAWETWGEALFAAVVLGCIRGKCIFDLVEDECAVGRRRGME